MNWIELSNEEIKKGVDEGGMAAKFTADYARLMGAVQCLNCRGWQSKLEEFKRRYFAEQEQKCGYVLKAKYNGLNGVWNHEMTAKKAKDLIKSHKKGEELFLKVPSKKEKDNGDRD